MFKNILSTIGTKVISSVVSFVIVILTANYLGAEAVGTIGLVVLGITIVLLVSNFIGGGALIYLVPRIEIYRLLVPSYAWSLISGIAVTLILYVFNLIPAEYAKDVFFLSIINSIASVNLNILLGKEKIRSYNLISLIQIVFQLGVFLILIIGLNKRLISSFIISLYFNFGTGLIVSSIIIMRSEVRSKKKILYEMPYVIRQILKYGSFVQVSNIIQLMNYRLSYYIINFYHGKTLLGIFTLGVQLSEGLWLVSKSMATVQYARISNSSDKNYSRELTIKFLKITFAVSLALLVPLMILPPSVFSFVFGHEFGDVKNVILFMSPGILSVAVNSMFSHFFSGTGRHYLNTIGSAIGFIITLAAGFLLIPSIGITGAAITASFSYLISLSFQYAMFGRITNSGIKDYLVSSHDVSFFVNELKKYIKT